MHSTASQHSAHKYGYIYIGKQTQLNAKKKQPLC
jgi:hypothetical protein